MLAASPDEEQTQILEFSIIQLLFSFQYFFLRHLRTPYRSKPSSFLYFLLLQSPKTPVSGVLEEQALEPIWLDLVHSLHPFACSEWPSDAVDRLIFDHTYLRHLKAYPLRMRFEHLQRVLSDEHSSYLMSEA